MAYLDENRTWHLEPLMLHTAAPTTSEEYRVRVEAFEARWPQLSGHLMHEPVGWLPIWDAAAEIWKDFPPEVWDGFRTLEVKEKLGDLRWYFQAPNDRDERLFKLSLDMRFTAEETCMACGKPAEIRTGGWHLALCNEHAPMQAGPERDELRKMIHGRSAPSER